MEATPGNTRSAATPPVFMAIVAMFALIGIAVVGNVFGILSWPFSAGNTGVQTHSVTHQLAPAKITKLELIALECRETIQMEVPVEGKVDHVARVLGVQVAPTRTDRAGLTAIGDIDVCVQIGSSRVLSDANGQQTVRIPASDIVYHRPRVDTLLSAQSAWYDAGWQAKLTNWLPFVSDNQSLSPAAFAYAQLVIGSHDCIAASWEVVVAGLHEAYRQQAANQGVDPNSVSVEIVGEPDFAVYAESIMANYSTEERAQAERYVRDFNFAVKEDEVVCELAPDFAFAATSEQEIS